MKIRSSRSESKPSELKLEPPAGAKPELSRKRQARAERRAARAVKVEEKAQAKQAKAAAKAEAKTHAHHHDHDHEHGNDHGHGHGEKKKYGCHHGRSTPLSPDCPPGEFTREKWFAPYVSFETPFIQSSRIQLGSKVEGCEHVKRKFKYFASPTFENPVGHLGWSFSTDKAERGAIFALSPTPYVCAERNPIYGGADVELAIPGLGYGLVSARGDVAFAPVFPVIPLPPFGFIGIGFEIGFRHPKAQKFTRPLTEKVIKGDDWFKAKFKRSDRTPPSPEKLAAKANVEHALNAEIEQRIAARRKV